MPRTIYGFRTPQIFRAYGKAKRWWNNLVNPPESNRVIATAVLVATPAGSKLVNFSTTGSTYDPLYPAAPKTNLYSASIKTDDGVVTPMVVASNIGTVGYTFATTGSHSAVLSLVDKQGYISTATQTFTVT